jgi:hypothetical protein
MRAFLLEMAKVALVISPPIVAMPLPANADDCTSSKAGGNCPVPDVLIPLVNVGSYECFEPTPEGDVAGLPIQQRACNPFFGGNPTPTIQFYEFVPLGAVLYNQGPPWWCFLCIHLGAEGFFIRNVVTGLCMDVRDGAKSDGAVVQQWTCRDSSARSMVWYTTQGDFPGALKLRNFNSDLCLDVKGGSSAEGTQLQQYHCTSNNPAQNFWQTNGPFPNAPFTVMDLNANWTDGSTRSARIYAGPGPDAGIKIDMSAFGRPNANGSIVDAATITVTFPDDKTYTGKLQPFTTITWSDGSNWTRD